MTKLTASKLNIITLPESNIYEVSNDKESLHTLKCMFVLVVLMNISLSIIVIQII